MFDTYESLPSKVKAVRFTEENKDRIFNAVKGNRTADHENGLPILKVQTVHGETAIVRIGDWIAQDRDIGTYYPIADDIFRVKYMIPPNEGKHMPALPVPHYCLAHQGNHSHYAEENCEMCRAQAEIERLRAEVERVVAKYDELLYAVQKKFPGESRHETALRYIRQSEEHVCGCASSDIPNPTDPRPEGKENGQRCKHGVFLSHRCRDCEDDPIAPAEIEAFKRTLPNKTD